MQHSSAHLTKTGNVIVGGKAVPYLIRRLPVSSFPELPDCGRGRSEAARLPDSADLPGAPAGERGACEPGAAGLVGLGGALLSAGYGHAAGFLRKRAGETGGTGPRRREERLQTHDRSGVLGFDWGIDPASPRQVREAQAAWSIIPPLLDHDALADTVLEKGYRLPLFLRQECVDQVDMPE